MHKYVHEHVEEGIARGMGDTQMARLGHQLPAVSSGNGGVKGGDVDWKT
jgi:hypothetical protein